MILKRVFLCLPLFIFSSFSAQSQIIEDVIELLTFHPNKERAEKDTAVYPSKIIISPIVFYAPETSWGTGFGAKYLFKFRGSGPETRTSNLPLAVTYTLENQYVLYSAFEMFTNEEKYVITGRAFYTSFPRLYYGVGRNTPESNEEQYSFNQLLLEPILLKRVLFKYLFVGGGIRFNNITGVEVEPDGQLADNNMTGERGSRSLGGEFAVLFDSRNNILFADTGWFAEFTHGIYHKKIGSTSNFRLTRFDIRHYMTPWKKNDDILAFHLQTQFSHGNVPIAELSQLGSDEIMRGYYEGRYLDNHLVAFQTEYRKTIKNRLGVVAFMSVGDVAADIRDFQFKNLRPTAGLGLRFMLDPTENLNLRFDYGVGKGTDNYYLNIGEAF